MLKRLGYAATGFSDPLEALRVFRASPRDFDAVVTDLSMPGMSGFELLKNVLEIRPGIPAIMTSGYLRPQDQETAAQLGLHALILKPNTIEELSEVLHQAFSEGR
jgi:CheY-like chemotaxis protein